jgi:uncharacterized iron-regulated membrane protein
MSLWNVALELHTGRVFEHLIGPFYILIVPLAGICILLVLISGFLLWWKVYRKKKILDEAKNSLFQVKLVKKGKIENETAKDFLNEL